MVEFKTIEKGQIRPGDKCILGLDVGSTTTKAVLMRKADDATAGVGLSAYQRRSGRCLPDSVTGPFFDQVKSHDRSVTDFN